MNSSAQHHIKTKFPKYETLKPERRPYDHNEIEPLCQITDSELNIVYKPYKANKIVHRIDIFEHPYSSDTDSAGVVITALVRDISYLSN